MHSDELIATVSWDSSGRIDYANEAFLGLVGYSQSDVSSGVVRLSAIVPDPTGQMLLRRTRGTHVSDTDPEPVKPGRGRELRLQRRDGSTVWCLSSTKLESCPACEGRALLVDISDWRDRASELDRLYRALDARVNVVVVRDELRHRAFRDWLTGLPNLAMFQDRLENAVTQADRTRGCIALVCVDLDHFETLDDSHGHNARERAIQQVARRLVECVRVGDTVARIGGDEFAVIVEQLASPSVLAQILKRVVGCFRQPVDVGSHSFEPGVSLGAVLHEGSSELTHSADPVAEQMIRRADSAMYLARASPVTRFHIFDPAVDQGGVPRVQHLESDPR